MYSQLYLGVLRHALIHAYTLAQDVRNIGDRPSAESSGVNKRFARRASGIAVLLAIPTKSAKVKSDFSSSDASSARYPSGYIRGSTWHTYFQSCDPPGFTSARARQRASFATEHTPRRDTVDPAPTRMPASSSRIRAGNFGGKKRNENVRADETRFSPGESVRLRTASVLHVRTDSRARGSVFFIFFFFSFYFSSMITFVRAGF